MKTYNDADARLALKKWLEDVKTDLVAYKEKQDNFLVRFFKNSALTTQRKLACVRVLNALDKYSIMTTFENVTNKYSNGQHKFSVSQKSEGISTDYRDAQQIAKQALKNLQDGIEANYLLTLTYARKGKNPVDPSKSTVLKDGAGDYAEILADYGVALESIKRRLDATAEQEPSKESFLGKWFGRG